jgi:hypothetical protein
MPQLPLKQCLQTSTSYWLWFGVAVVMVLEPLLAVVAAALDFLWVLLT